MLGLAGRLLTNAKLYGEDPYFAIVEEDGRVVAAALRTPPHNLILSETDAPARYVALAEDARAAFHSLPGVVGPAAAIEAFVSAWTSLTGDSARLVMSERIYEATEVIAPRRVDGRMRPVTEQDHDLVLGWVDAFMLEALPFLPADARGFLERRAADPAAGLVVWDDGAPVSIAGYGGPTPHGIRIGPVYTPPELRGGGYASALVAELTQELLSNGRDFCFLFTDLANATSNSIYQRVGYRPVTDVEQLMFERVARRVG
ncbi:MAG: GNAT family N-acetyltransferase [Gaiellaceae bacterium]